MPTGVIVFLCVFGALWLFLMIWLIRGAVRAFRRSRRMVKEFPAYAAQRGWEYRKQDLELPREFSGDPFDRYGRKEALHALIGTHDGRPCTAFELMICEDSGRPIGGGIRIGGGGGDDDNDHHVYGVVALRMTTAAPSLEVHSAGHLHRALDKISGHDVKTGDETFDHDFSVHCSAPDFARALLDPGTIALVREHRDLRWRFQGDSMLVIRYNNPFDAAEVDDILTFMDAILDRLPAYQPRPEQG